MKKVKGQKQHFFESIKKSHYSKTEQRQKIAEYLKLHVYELFRLWLISQINLEEYSEVFKNQFYIMKVKQKVSEDDFNELKKFKYFKTKNNWKIQFSHFLVKYDYYEETRKFLENLIEGKFYSSSQLIEFKTFHDLEFLQTYIIAQGTITSILFESGVLEIPCINHINQKVYAYKYQNCIRFLEINHNSKNSFIDCYPNLIDKFYATSPFKNYHFKPEISQEILKQNNFNKYLFKFDRQKNGELTAKLNLLNNSSITKILPLTFIKQLIEFNNTQQSQSQQYSNICQIDRPLGLKQMKIMKNMQNLQYIQCRMQKIVQEDFKLSKEQKEFTQSCISNTLLTGRSGTGKTITALMWAIQNIGQKMNSQNTPINYIFVTSNSEKRYRLNNIYNKIIKNQSEQQQIQPTNSFKNPDSLQKSELYKEINKHEQQDEQINLIQPGISFFQIRDFLYTIDGYLTYPFFSHYTQNNRQYKTNNQNNQYPIEADFNLFQKDFCSTSDFIISQMIETSPHYVWCYILSELKGNYQEHRITPIQLCKNNNYFYQEKYKRLMLTNQPDRILFRYEKWKFTNRYYDLLDVISYQIDQIQSGNWQKLPIDFLIVDDIQDLPNSILYLFQLVSQKQLVMIGDGANITDLQILRGNDQFSNLVYLDIVEQQNIQCFKINHRLSNNNIIKIANSILKLLNYFESDTITNMIDLRNNDENVKTLIIKENHIQSIIELGYLQNTNNPNQDFTFGYDTVIIVRNKQQKDEMNNLLRFFQILTIQEAQGLEFNQVILFNFFLEYQNFWQLIETYDSQNKEKQRIKYHLQTLISLLRQLYSVVTRCKKQLIIYDNRAHNRIFIEQIWKRENLIQTYKFQQPQIKNEEIIKKWHDLGLNMLKQQYFVEASHCFKNSGSEIKEREALLYLELQKCQQIDDEIQELIYNLKYSKTKFQRKLKNQLISQREVALLNLGQKFEQINLNLKAAQCYFQAKEFGKALQLFISLGMKNEAAQISMILGHFKQASQFYLDINDVKNAVLALDKAKDYEYLLELVRKQKFTMKERQEYLNKYFPLYFNQLLEQIDQQENQKIQDSNKKDQTQIIIEDVDEENENSQDSCELTFQKLDQLKNNEINQDEYGEESEEFSVQNSQQSEDQIEQNNITESFSVQQKYNNSQLEKFEHLSNYDPDDQWLMQSDNRSIIESIISKQSDSSDFSAFSYAQIQTNPQMQLVTTKANIYVQDQIMQKIIKNVRLFQQEFEVILQHEIPNQQVNNQFDVEMMLDLDFVDHKLINLILNVLEQFKCFKLCIFVCNRYKLADKLGRYLVSIAANYSPICVESTLINNKNYQILQYGTKRQHQIDKTIVASYAVHSVLEILNPEYQRLKFDNEPLNMLNSLGLKCYSEMIILGLWKKILYQLDINNAISVCEIYLDFKNWKFIYFTNHIHKLELELSKQENSTKLQGELLICQKKLKQCFDNLSIFDVLYFNQPLYHHQTELTLICLEQFYITLTYQLVLNNIVDSSAFFFKGTMDPKVYKIDLTKIRYPTFLSQSQEFVDAIFVNQDINLQLLQDIITNFNLPESNEINQIKVFESSILLYLTLIISLWSQDNEIILTRLISDEVFYKLKSCFNKFEKQFNSQSQFNRRIKLLLFKTREIESQNLFQFYKTKLFVHRSSVIVKYLVSGKQNQNELIKGYTQDADFEFVIIEEDIGWKLIQNQFNKEFNQLAILRNKSIIKKMELAGKIEFDDLSKILTTKFIGEEQAKIESLKIRKRKTQLTETQSLTDLYLKIEQESAKLKQKEKYEMAYLDQVREQIWNQNVKYQDKLKIYKKEFYKNLLMRQQRVVNSVKDYLIIKGLNLLEQSLYTQNESKKHKKIIQGILILDHSNANHYSLAFLEKNKLQQYCHFIEYLVCRNDQIYTDAFLCYNQYISYKKHLISYEERELTLISLFLNQFMQFRFSYSCEGTIRINQAYRDYFPDFKGDYVEYNSQISKDPIILMDTLESLMNESIDHSHIFNLIIFILINQEQQVEDWLRKIKEVLSQLTQQHPNSKIIKLLEDLISENSLILKLQLIQQYQDCFQCQWIDLNIVNILKSQEQQERQYNNSLARWQEYSCLNKIVRRNCKIIWDRFKQSFQVVINEKQIKSKIIYDKLFNQLKQIQCIFSSHQFNHPRSFHELANLADRLLEKIKRTKIEIDQDEIDQFIQYQVEEFNKWKTQYQTIVSVDQRNEVITQKWANLQLKFAMNK